MLLAGVGVAHMEWVHDVLYTCALIIKDLNFVLYKRDEEVRKGA